MLLPNLPFPPGTIDHFELIRERPTHTVHRLTAGGRQYILKSFLREPVKEIQVYALLEALGVPTLPVPQRGANFLLMEDLETSPTWRLARPEDMRRVEVGRAVAEWYRVLHQAGRQQAQLGWPAFLQSWVDPLVEPALREAGRKLGLEDAPAWQEALTHLEEWKAAYRTFPQTFNYSDFADENLALSRANGARAVVFDYDVFATGSVFSDVRNVIGSLEGPARDAFLEAYGPFDRAEEEIDTPLSLLEGILVAAQLERVPGWARPIIQSYL